MTEAAFFTKPPLRHSSCAQAGAQIPQGDGGAATWTKSPVRRRSTKRRSLTLETSQLTSCMRTVGQKPGDVAETYGDEDMTCKRRAQCLGIEVTTHPRCPLLTADSRRRVEVGAGKRGLCCQVAPSPFRVSHSRLLMQQGVRKKRRSSYIIQNGPRRSIKLSLR